MMTALTANQIVTGFWRLESYAKCTSRMYEALTSEEVTHYFVGGLEPTLQCTMAGFTTSLLLLEIV